MKYLCYNQVNLHTPPSLIWHFNNYVYFVSNSPLFFVCNLMHNYSVFEKTESNCTREKNMRSKVHTLIMMPDIYKIISDLYINKEIINNNYLFNSFFCYWNKISVFMSMQSWNNFLWPLIVLRTGEKFTLPIIIVFIFFQRYFIAGLTSGGVKG